MEFKSINPFNMEFIKAYNGLSDDEVLAKTDHAFMVQKAWQQLSVRERIPYFIRLSSIMKTQLEDAAKLMSLEMGKPITEARAEFQKCQTLCDYYIDHAEEFLENELIETEAKTSMVRHDALGLVLAIMPWNFPFWQVFRFAVPALIAGNACLLKHAPNVLGCADFIEKMFDKAGFPQGIFSNMLISHGQSAELIANPKVKAVSLTGSERAGREVAALAGKHLKKVVLELGGSNAFIVCADADLKNAASIGVQARMLNSGQSCIAAKRFLVEERVYDEYLDLFCKELSKWNFGNPLLDSTKVGPLARLDLAEGLSAQLKDSLKQGAVLRQGGNQEGCYFEPSVVENVAPGMRVFDEETFGPLACFTKVKNREEALTLAKSSNYGLGLSIMTQDVDWAMNAAAEVEDGACFINQLVKSDPRLPFGGTKISGFGRELGKDGILEFVNRKTVVVY